ncbi:splicing factor U2af large subunit A isoform X2 [Phoenix dactylifera]|uniref:Splicing factor U2af large subunit n=1 Tax=Phoenix dactylifera TaxID=42345 RepID=A0A8B8ZAH0_PHODC|nr:splicing factor U2af large subunit A isoform X2 [Phoenix dactylifera]
MSGSGSRREGSGEGSSIRSRSSRTKREGGRGDRGLEHNSRDFMQGKTRMRVRDGDRDGDWYRDNKRDQDRGRERNQYGERERDHGRERDQNYHRRDHHRNTNTKDDGGKDRSDESDCHGNHDNDRYREYDRDGSRRNRHVSCSRSPSKSKRVSGFDMAPPGAPLLPGAAGTGQLPGIPQPLTGILPTMFPLPTLPLGSMSVMPAPAMTQQATRHARRVYVGGLPPMANEQTIATFFSNIMTAIGGNAAGPGDAVVNVYINHEKKFAFVEMRTVEEASNAMALDGIIFEGVSVRVRRPTDYNPSLAAALGPSHPNPHLNLAAAGLTLGTIGGAEGPDRIFVGGLPYYFTDAQIKELLESFGPLRGFDLVKDKDTGNSKGYGFCAYQDPSVTDVACAALNGLKMGDKTLTVRRASASTGQIKPEQELILQQAQQHIAMQKMALQAGNAPPFPGAGLALAAPVAFPTKVLCLTEVASIDELRDDEEYSEILEDMREESGKFGSLVNVIIPRPTSTGELIPGVGKLGIIINYTSNLELLRQSRVSLDARVFLEYTDVTGSTRAKVALHGRKFSGNIVTASYYPEDKFTMGDYGAAAVG